MKKSEITKDFLLEQLKKHLLYENDVDWSNRFKDYLRQGLESTEIAYKESDEFKLLEEFNNDDLVTDIKKDINDENYVMDYDTFENYNESLDDCTYHDIEKEYKRYEKRLKEIEIAASLYAEHISTFPDELEYEINFSDKSVSIYIIVNIVPINENREKFMQKDGFSPSFDDQYEECYTEEELNAFNELEIRLSNHNFGGNEFISYRKDCVNCVFNF